MRRTPALYLDLEWGPDEADQIEEIRTKNAEIGAGLLIVDSVGMACGATSDGDPAGPFALGRQNPLWGRRMIKASEG